jgi:hypothetical protein
LGRLALRQEAQELSQYQGMGGDALLEVRLAQLQDGRIRRGDHVGGARLAGQQRHLSEEAPRLRERQHSLLPHGVEADDLHPAVKNQVHGIGRITPPEDSLPFLETAILQPRGDPRQLFVRELLEDVQ